MKKWITIIILLFGQSACNNQTDRNMVEEKPKPVSVESICIDSNEMGGDHKEYHNCKFENFIADNSTPKLAKDIYLDNDWDLSNENELLALLDSLTAKNKSSRPFYFKVITKTYQKSDGYFSEGLGYKGTEYVENNTKEFISNFDNLNCFTSNDLITWADIVILEFSLGGKRKYEKPIIDEYINKLKSNCKDSSPKQLENMNKFCFILKGKWDKFLENIVQ